MLVHVHEAQRIEFIISDALSLVRVQVTCSSAVPTNETHIVLAIRIPSSVVIASGNSVAYPLFILVDVVVLKIGLALRDLLRVIRTHALSLPVDTTSLVGERHC